MTALFGKWRAANTPILKGIAERRQAQGADRDAVGRFAGDLPDGPAAERLRVYQHLMDYWAETMQDDVYMLVTTAGKRAGWQAQHRPNPAPLVIRRYFAAEQEAIDKLEQNIPRQPYAL